MLYYFFFNKIELYINVLGAGSALGVLRENNNNKIAQNNLSDLEMELAIPKSWSKIPHAYDWTRILVCVSSVLSVF